MPKRAEITTEGEIEVIYDDTIYMSNRIAQLLTRAAALSLVYRVEVVEEKPDWDVCDAALTELDERLDDLSSWLFLNS